LSAAWVRAEADTDLTVFELDFLRSLLAFLATRFEVFSFFAMFITTFPLGYFK
jgi:hypothetical protein